MNDEERLLAVWLLPCREHASLIQPLIDALAAQTGQTTFPAHVTLIARRFPADAFPADDAIQTLIARLAGEHAPITTNRLGLERGAAFTRALFITLAETAALSALRRNALDLFSAPDTPFEPHLSLGYGLAHHDAAIDASVLPDPLVCDSLMWIKGPAIVADDAAVRAWRHGAPTPLG